ncbi:MAG: 50S ribosomal protein L30 [Eubacteriales bacterium]|nr:50S ribosomal protein L30 [Eubacteriales bacterium]MDD4583092.1 50S ribosomal protein L30 [Eubacteriales bacterium]
MADKKVKITLTKSPIGASPNHRKIVEALGLKKMHQAIEQPDNPQTRGAIEKIRHLVTVEEL